MGAEVELSDLSLAHRQEPAVLLTPEPPTRSPSENTESPFSEPSPPDKCGLSEASLPRNRHAASGSTDLISILFGPSGSDAVNLESLRTEVAASGLPDDERKGLCAPLSQPIRPLTWKLLLGVSSVNRSEWREEEELAKEELYWIRLRWVRGEKTGVEDEKEDHPLSESTQSRWRREFDAKNWLTIIDKDVDRTKSEYGRRFSRISSSLRNILLLYSVDNSTFGYRQGMNEIAATLLLAMDPEPSSTRAPPTSLEAGAYFAFVEVMIEMAPLFSPSDPAPMDTQLALLSKALRRADKTLFLKLKQLDIDLRFFASKWMKLWFAQSFMLPDLFRLWDAILSSEVRLPWLRVLIVARLSLKREKILACSNLPQAMNILLNEGVDVDDLLRKGGTIWPGSLYENRIQLGSDRRS